MAGTGLQQLFTESISSVTSTKSAGLALGTVRYEAYNGEDVKWQYIYNGGNSAIAPTYGLCLLSNSSGGYTMTISSVASYSVMRGLVVHATIGTSQYGWVLKEGTATFEGGVGSFQSTRGIVAGANGVFENATTVSGQSADIGILNVCGDTIGSFATGASGLGHFNFS